MYEKEINRIEVSFIFLRKSLPGNVFYRCPKMLKIDYSGGWGGGVGQGGAGRSHVPGYMAQDFWTIGPLAHGSKIPK